MISKSAEEAAYGVTEKFNRLLAEQDAALKGGGVDKDFVVPSDIWEPIQYYSYCLQPTAELFRTWRFHHFPFTGNYMGTAIGTRENPIPYKQLVRYFKLTAGLPDWCIIRPPEECGELGWRVNGGMVNLDVLSTQFYLSTLYHQGILSRLREQKNPTILEIGGGHGPLAWALKQVVPNATIVLTDLTMSLFFAAVYLTLVDHQNAGPETVYDGIKNMSGHTGKYGFVPNFLLNKVTDMQFDLVTVCGAFSEMSTYQVKWYRDFLAAHVAPQGIIYGANGEGLNPVTNIMAEVFHGDILDRTQRVWVKDESVFSELNKIKKQLPPKPGRFAIAKKVFGFKHAADERRALLRDWRGIVRAASAWYDLFFVK
ncbi:MAG: putative sugar O-methyltransferase [Candidatus Liptonbacteria bacterium]